MPIITSVFRKGKGYSYQSGRFGHLDEGVGICHIAHDKGDVLFQALDAGSFWRGTQNIFQLGLATTYDCGDITQWLSRIKTF